MREPLEEFGREAVGVVETLPIEPAHLAAGVAALAVLLLLAGVVRRRRRTADVRASRRSHRRAREREPPVDVGDVAALGVREFTRHHSGERHAVGKVEGFVVFVEDVPDGVREGDAIRAKVLSFNRGRTSATATYLGRA